MKNYILVFLVFSIAYTTQAITIHWNGGIGNWGDATQWDSGTVPTNLDQIVIPSGTVKISNNYDAIAERITIDVGATLLIKGAATLTLRASSGYGISNQGTITNYGTISIDEVSGTGILNYNTFRNKPGAQLSINNTSAFGINNIGTSFSNKGEIHISDTEYSSIINAYAATFKNHHIIVISESTEYGIYNYEESIFNNLESGSIDIDNQGILDNFLSGVFIHNSEFINAGLVSIRNYEGSGHKGMHPYLDGILTNHSTGIIEVDNCHTGLFNTTTSNVYNYGQINISNTGGTGYTIDGDLVNFTDGSIVINETVGTGFSMGTSSNLTNYGNVSIANSLIGKSIHVNFVYNYFCSQITVTDEITIHSVNGVLYNQGSLNIAYNGTIDVYPGSSFQNQGVIEDRYGAIDPAQLINTGIIIQPVTDFGTLLLPLQNALVLGTSTDLEIGDWSIVTGEYLAGTYNQTANTFSPGIFGIGADLLSIEITNTAFACSDTYVIYREGALPNSEEVSPEAITSTNTFQVYPNPAIRQSLIHFDLPTDLPSQISLFDTKGNRLLNQTSNGQQLRLPPSLASGIYLLDIQASDGQHFQERLVIID